ncbi:MAG: SDR family oxidoreductase [Candidatus Omnitrophica bacterium]|nr:SDR family oxidoreductase [Candidatus Omnitrophota bacterium]
MRAQRGELVGGARLMTRRVVITGASGLLGAHVMAALNRDHDVTGVDRHPWWGDEPVRLIQADLEAPDLLPRIIAEADPEVVIHCAALTNVDVCERDPGRADAVNAGLTRAIARVLAPTCLMVYISTDGVLSGQERFASEGTPPVPRTAYGRSKWRGEQAVMESTVNHLVIRTNFYGWSSGRKRTAGEWVYQSLREGRDVTLFHDVYFTPIYVVDFVDRLLALLDQPYRGVLHVGGRDRVSKEQFGRLMAEVGRFSTAHARSGSVEDAPLAASRPKDTSMTSQRCEELTALTAPSCREGLQRFLADRERTLSQRTAAGRPKLSCSPPVEP